VKQTNVLLIQNFFTFFITNDLDEIFDGNKLQAIGQAKFGVLMKIAGHHLLH
jgi:hypothetical protein